MNQTMNARAAQKRIDQHAQNYGAFIRDGQWSLEHAHSVLKDEVRVLSLFQVAGLAKAIACFQCSEA